MNKASLPQRRRGLALALRATIGVHVATPFAALAMPQTLPWLAAGLAGNHLALAAAGMWPRSTLLGPNVRRLPAASAARREVALTFDDGPDPEITPRVLALLEEAGAHASFFCIGSQARAHPALVRRIVQAGHSIENHSDTHPAAFACYSPAALRRQIGLAQATLTDLSGAAPGFFRAPMGLRSPLLDPVLAETSLRFVSWTRRALDGVRTDPQAGFVRLTTRLAAGDILLLHDGRAARAPSGAPMVLEILPGLLAALRGAGLTAIPLPAAFMPPVDAPAGA